MKTKIFILIIILATPFTTIHSQTLPEVDGKVIYENLQLQKQGSYMILTFDTRIADKAINNRQSWKVIPEILSTDTRETIHFPSLLINGRQKERHYKRRLNFKNRELLANKPAIHTHVPQDQEQLIHYRAEIPYQNWMENSTLIFHQILTSPREKKQLFTTAAMAIRTPEPPKPEAPPVITPQPAPANTLTINGEAQIRFPVGITDIYPAYMDNTHELEKIEKEIRRILHNPDYTLISIQLTGYASPEARYSTNKRLSESRTQTLKEYLAEKYNLAPEIIRTSSVPEDWKRLRQLIQNSQLTDKNKILTIIDSGEPEDTKEKQLRAMPAAWNTLLKDYFPQLRRVDYQILYKKTTN
ncbi:MAG: DUF3868 domain-containing protein [Tannerellaceae bacterium]|nr:DUF3868 domain-containing protein [Tannerellaceae bacterium]